jgi:hypothetical protein
MELENSIITKEVHATMSDVKIYTSREYDIFVLSELNRVPGHYKKVLESIKENDYTKYQPILVNKKMEIVDGQNRFLACRDLGIPIHFIVSETINILAAADINKASKNWNSMDYVQHYAKRGRESYIDLLDICAKYDQKLSVVQQFGKLTNNHKSSAECVKAGDFQFKKEVDIDAFFKHVQIFSEYYSFSKQDKFVLKLYLAKGYSETRMTKKLRSASAVVHEQPRQDLMTIELLKLYNYHSKVKLSL